MDLTAGTAKIVAFVLLIWIVRELFGVPPNREFLFWAMVPFLVAAGLAFMIGKSDFERTNEAGVQVFSSFWRASAYRFIRYITMLVLLIVGIVAAFIAAFSGWK